MLLSIEKTTENNIEVLKLQGVLDIATVEVFMNSFNNLDGMQEVNIDLDKLEFIDSTGIGAIAQAVKKYQEKGVAIKIINISNDVYEVFDILGLPEIFGEGVFVVK